MIATGAVLLCLTAAVVDGDTLACASGERVRLWRVDADERRQPGGAGASARLAELALDRELRCTVKDIDRYGRPVARCKLPDGRDPGEVLLREGLAREDAVHSRGFYRRAEREAACAGRGLWARYTLDTLPPWHWRACVKE